MTQFSGPSEKTMSTVVTTATNQAPAPAAMPTPAVAQRLAAVVRPRTDVPYLRIAPAPRKPMPETIWAAIREGSVGIEPFGAGGASKKKIERTVKAADPSETSRCVRIPAGWAWISRSRPIAAPRTEATTNRRRYVELHSQLYGQHRMGDLRFSVGGSGRQSMAS